VFTGLICFIYQCTFDLLIDKKKIARDQSPSLKKVKSMKKNLTSHLIPALCLATALLLGCGSDDPSPQSCDNDVKAFEAALNAYMADPVISKCEALKDAADELLDCPGITAAQRAQYEDAVQGATCD
jgi:hypothetical protein